jgi:hypothetical protein
MVNIVSNNRNDVSPKKPKISTNFLIINALVILLVALGGLSYYFYTKYQKAKSIAANPTEAAKQESNVLIEKVSKLMELPRLEEPTVATVSDKEKLKEQPFFKGAEVGDKVLIYIQARKAILYRPSTNKIIEVSPVNIQQASDTDPTPTTKP